MSNIPERVHLTLTLPSGKVCRIGVRRENTGDELIAALLKKGLIEEDSYGFVAEDNRFIMSDMPLDFLFAPGASQATALLTTPFPYHPADSDEYWDDFDTAELYGCPTAVTAQADQLTNCTVTRTDL